MKRKEFIEKYNLAENFDGKRYIKSDILRYWSRSVGVPEILTKIQFETKLISNYVEKILDHQFVWRKFERNIYETVFKVKCLACLWNDKKSKEKLFIFTKAGVITIKTPPSDHINNLYLTDAYEDEVLYNPENIK